MIQDENKQPLEMFHLITSQPKTSNLITLQPHNQNIVFVNFIYNQKMILSC